MATSTTATSSISARVAGSRSIRRACYLGWDVVLTTEMSESLDGGLEELRTIFTGKIVNKGAN